MRWRRAPRALSASGWTPAPPPAGLGDNRSVTKHPTHHINLHSHHLLPGGRITGYLSGRFMCRFPPSTHTIPQHLKITDTTQQPTHRGLGPRPARLQLHADTFLSDGAKHLPLCPSGDADVPGPLAPAGGRGARADGRLHWAAARGQGDPGDGSGEGGFWGGAGAGRDAEDEAAADGGLCLGIAGGGGVG